MGTNKWLNTTIRGGLKATVGRDSVKESRAKPWKGWLIPDSEGGFWKATFLLGKPPVHFHDCFIEVNPAVPSLGNYMAHGFKSLGQKVEPC